MNTNPQKDNKEPGLFLVLIAIWLGLFDPAPKPGETDRNILKMRLKLSIAFIGSALKKLFKRKQK